MAWQLVREVLDHAPPDLTAAELAVLVAIAEKLPLQRREVDYLVRHLVRRTRLKERGLRAAVTRLAERGIEVRVPIGKDSKGRPLYAAYGLAPRWTLPTFDPQPGCGCEECEASGGGTVVTVGGTTVPPPKVGGTTESSEGRSATDPRHHSVEAGSLSTPMVDTTVPATPSVPKAEDGEPLGWRRPNTPLPGSLMEKERAKRAAEAAAAGKCPTHLTKRLSNGECTGCKVDQMVGGA